MRIAHVCADRGVPVHGTAGSSVHLRSLVGALTGEGAEVAVFASRRGAGDALPVEELPGGPVAGLLAAGDAEDRELGQVLAAAEVARRLDRRHRQARFDVVYERWSLWGTGGLEFALRRRVPFFLEVNAPLVDEAVRHRGLRLEGAARAIERLLLRNAHRILVVSRPLRDHVVGCGAAPERVVVTPNGVDPVLFAPIRRKPAGAAGPLVVGFVGSLKPWHGLPVLIEAIRRFAERRPVRLVIAGDGPLRPEVEAAVRELGGETVAWLGAVPHERVPQVLAGCDVAVAPYAERDIYFSPLKVVEAMAAGVCVVASRAGDLEDLVREGETGLLVTPGDADALARALLRVDADRDLGRRLGAAARAAVLATRTWPLVARRVLAELESVRGESEREAAGAA